MPAFKQGRRPTHRTRRSVESDRSHQYLWIALAVSGGLALVSLGCVVWIAADPEYWFPGAYAEQGEKGPRGDAGHRGPIGRRGPEGPAGPGVDEVEARVEEVASTADDALAASEDTRSLANDAQSAAEEAQSTADQAFATADEALSTAQDACSELALNTDSFGC
jgi:hypothetical protein